MSVVGEITPALVRVPLLPLPLAMRPQRLGVRHAALPVQLRPELAALLLAPLEACLQQRGVSPYNQSFFFPFSVA